MRTGIGRFLQRGHLVPLKLILTFVLPLSLYHDCWTNVLKCDMITITRSVSFTDSFSLSFHRTWWSSTWNSCWIFWRSRVQISTRRLDVLIEVYRGFLQILQKDTGLVPHITPESPNLTSLVQWLRLTLCNGPNKVGVSPSPVDGNRSSCRNVVFCRIPDDGQSPKPQ
jgi:hypothetical protein